MRIRLGTYQIDLEESVPLEPPNKGHRTRKVGTKRADVELFIDTTHPRFAGYAKKALKNQRGSATQANGVFVFKVVKGSVKESRP